MTSQTDLDTLLDAMTLEEQVSLLTGASFWRTAAIDRLGIPAIKLTDGPNGARGEDFSGGVRSAAYPVPVALAATWNPQLVQKVGADLAREARSKGARVLLAPTVNMHRNPLNGRNFECFSEDPKLASAIAVAYVRGVQGEGVAATIKHFIGNECEHERRTTSSRIDEATLRQIYFPPFEAAVKEAGVACIMTAYNALNGIHTSQHAWLLGTVLRDEWGFDGVVMSDWTATHTTAESLIAGLDLEMPGPGKQRGAKLVDAVCDGQVPAEAVRASARRILALGQRVGASATDDLDAERADDRPETRALIRRAGAEAAVLLKNDGLLPIDPAFRRIAVIGPNAARAVMYGGGSAQINAHYAISPLEGLRAALPDCRIDYALGCSNDRYLPHVAGEVRIRFYTGTAFEGAPVLTQISDKSEFRWFGPVAPEVDDREFSARLDCRFTATESGLHDISLMSAGTSRLFVDGQPVIEAWETWERGYSYFGHGCAERHAQVRLEAGLTYDIAVDYACGDGITTTLKAVRFGLRSPSGQGSVEDAVALARDADAVILVTGLNDDWETEAEDRLNLALPPGQDALVAAVLAANSRTAVVVQSGGPVSMPWADEAPAILQLWYPGQECGNALADVLTGRAEPSGRLPQTFPVDLASLGSLVDRPVTGATIAYDEGTLIGYRRCDDQGVAPQFPFGHGLGYALIEIETVVAHPAEQGIRLQVGLRNISARHGTEVVQVYLRTADNDRWLRGFDKVPVAARSEAEAWITLTDRDLSVWLADGWTRVVEGACLEIGRSVEDIALSVPLG